MIHTQNISPKCFHTRFFRFRNIFSHNFFHLSFQQFFKFKSFHERVFNSSSFSGQPRRAMRFSYFIKLRLPVVCASVEIESFSPISFIVDIPSLALGWVCRSPLISSNSTSFGSLLFRDASNSPLSSRCSGSM